MGMDESTPAAGVAQAELRLAVSMNGGVSLAVWIGGVANELYELALSDSRRTEGRYQDLVDLLDVDVEIDVISGSSAGGINGALLGVAIANDAPSIESVRRLWLDDGDVESLLHEASTREPKSLFRGEDFRNAIRNGLDLVAADSRDPSRSGHVECHLTASRLDPSTTLHRDAIGGLIADTDYETVFRFVHEASDARSDPARRGSVPLRRDLHRSNVDQLAVAARASASFPVAFEPVWVRTTKDERGFNTRRVVGKGTITGGGWFIDGGTLNNKPIRPAIEAVFRRSASGRVIRNLAYVVPDPGSLEPVADEETTELEDPSDAPGIWSVLHRAILTLPRNQSIGSELRQIREHNDRVGHLHDAQMQLAAELGSELVAAARPFEGLYRQHQARKSAQRSVGHLIRFWSREQQWSEVSQRISALALENALATHRKDRYPKPFLPNTDPSVHGEHTADNPETFWGYGVAVAKRIAAVAIDVTQAALSHVPARPTDEILDSVATLTVAQTALHEHLHAMIAAGESDTAWFPVVAREVASADSEFDIDAWASRYYADWNEGTGDGVEAAGKRERFTSIGAASLGCADELTVRIAPAIRALAAWASVSPGSVPAASVAALEELKLAVNGLTVRNEADDGVDLTDAQWALRQLLALELLYFATSDAGDTDQRLDLVQFSAYATDHVTKKPRRTPADKLTGVALGHFAAFYKRSWRANDWMWGRLDAASRLVDLMCRPDRLRQVWFGQRENFIDALRAAAVDSTTPELRKFLEQEWAATMRSGALDAEIDAVCRDGSGADTAAGNLGKIRRVIARRYQLEIVLVELPGVAKAVLADQDAGSIVLPEAREFLRSAAHAFDIPTLLGQDRRKSTETKIGPPPSAVTESPTETANGDATSRARTIDIEAVIYAFGDCRIGTERVSDDIGSDRLTSLAGRATAVASSSLRAVNPPTVVKPALAALRGVGRTTHLLSGLATSNKNRSSTTQFMLLAAFAAGGASLAIAIVAGNPGLVTTGLGLGLVAGPLIVASRGGAARWTAISLVCVVALGLVAWNIDALLDGLGVDPGGDAVRTGWSGQLVVRRETVTIVVVLLGFLWMGRDVVGSGTTVTGRPWRRHDDRRRQRLRSK